MKKTMKTLLLVCTLVLAAFALSACSDSLPDSLKLSGTAACERGAFSVTCELERNDEGRHVVTAVEITPQNLRYLPGIDYPADGEPITPVFPEREPYDWSYTNRETITFFKGEPLLGDSGGYVLNIVEATADYALGYLSFVKGDTPETDRAGAIDFGVMDVLLTAENGDPDKVPQDWQERLHQYETGETAAERFPSKGYNDYLREFVKQAYRQDDVPGMFEDHLNTFTWYRQAMESYTHATSGEAPRKFASATWLLLSSLTPKETKAEIAALYTDKLLDERNAIAFMRNAKALLPLLSEDQKLPLYTQLAAVLLNSKVEDAARAENAEWLMAIVPAEQWPQVFSTSIRSLLYAPDWPAFQKKVEQVKANMPTAYFLQKLYQTVMEMSRYGHEAYLDDADNQLRVIRYANALLPDVAPPADDALGYHLGWSQAPDDARFDVSRFPELQNTDALPTHPCEAMPEGTVLAFYPSDEAYGFLAELYLHWQQTDGPARALAPERIPASIDEADYALVFATYPKKSGTYIGGITGYSTIVEAFVYDLKTMECLGTLGTRSYSPGMVVMVPPGETSVTAAVDSEDLMGWALDLCMPKAD